MLLIENKNYRLHHRSSASSICIVSFSGFGAEEQINGRFFMDQTAKKLDFEIYGVVAKYNCWYLNEGIEQIINEIKNKIDKRKKIIMYGVSMGAFAALKYSKHIKPDFILSFAPQFSLDKKQRDNQFSFYDQFYQDYMDGMNILQEDISGLPYVIYDPDIQHEDGENFTLIKKKAQMVRGIKVFHTGHMVVSHLKGAANFLEIINFLHNEDKLRANTNRFLL